MTLVFIAASAIAAGKPEPLRELRRRNLVAGLPGVADAALMEPDGKCGTRPSQAISGLWNSLTESDRARVRSVFAPDEYQKIRIAGHFEIHYDTTGDDAPAMLDIHGERIPGSAEEYIDSVAASFNLAYDVEVGELGFDPPPVQAGHLGYEVDVRELSGTVYGQTYTLDQTNPGMSPPRFTTYVEVDNDFRGYYTAGIAGLQVTSAHEFHHCIQFGSYGAWGLPYAWFYEITAVWMEEVVHTDVNDYLNYLRTPAFAPRGQFEHPEYSLCMSNGLIEYSRGIFGKFIEQRYSAAMMRRIWEEMRTSSVLPAMNRALTDSGSTLRKAFLEWTLWNYHTGRRADTVHYYREGMEYPEIARRDTTYYFSPSGYFRDSVQSLASVYHPVSVNGETKFYTVISNLNAAPPSFFTFEPFTYLMSDAGDESYSFLDSLMYVKVDAAVPSNWRSQESIAGTPPNIVTEGEAFVYPNPFGLRLEDRSIKFVVRPTTELTGHLFVLTPGMNVLVNRDLPIKPDDFDRPSITWDAASENPSSGVYIYHLTVGGNSYNGKFAIVKP